LCKEHLRWVKKGRFPLVQRVFGVPIYTNPTGTSGHKPRVLLDCCLPCICPTIESRQAYDMEGYNHATFYRDRDTASLKNIEGQSAQPTSNSSLATSAPLTGFALSSSSNTAQHPHNPNYQPAPFHYVSESVSQYPPFNGPSHGHTWNSNCLESSVSSRSSPRSAIP
jgi:hypothetical protein